MPLLKQNRLSFFYSQIYINSQIEWKTFPQISFHLKKILKFLINLNNKLSSPQNALKIMILTQYAPIKTVSLMPSFVKTKHVHAKKIIIFVS